MHCLNLEQIQHSFGKRIILFQVGFSCNTGDVLAIFGRNGSGKSTLFKSLFGTLKPDIMKLFLDGKPIGSSSPKAKFIACLPQNSFLPKDVKVRNLIAMYFQEDEGQNRIFHSPLVHKLENQRAGTLSLGELRYLEFLLVVNLSHPFILLDEPFSMIEPLYKDAIKEIIQEYRKDKGFIITDHYYNDVLQVATKCLILKDGISKEVKGLDDLVTNGYLPEHVRRS